MKKTVTVNLGGYVFHIDDDACIRLDDYLRKIEAGLTDPEEAKEVIHDIELRLSELFKERLGNDRQVINMDDVAYVIKVMGEPEVINENGNGSAGATSSSSRIFGKRMYRDPEGRILGGVCSGLAAYFGMDPVIMRIIMVLTFFVLGPLLYIVLWIAMPEAKTTAQKLEMKGEPVNVENIQRNIKDEFEKVKSSIKKEKTKREVESVFREIFSVMGRVILIFLKVFLGIAGISLILAGVVLLLSFTDIFVFDGWQTGLNGLSDFMLMMVNPAIYNLSLISLFLIIGIPVVAILLGLFRMITHIKTNRYVSSGLGIAWFCGIILMIILLVSQARNFRTESSRTKIITLDSLKTNSLSVNTTIPDLYENEWASGEVHYLWSVDKNDEFEGLYTLTELYILPTEDSVPAIKSELTARGKNKLLAVKSIDTSFSVYSLSDSVLNIAPGFLVNKDSPFRFQKCKLKLYLPEGFKIYLSPGIAQILVRAENTSYLDYYDMGGKNWVMTEKGLKLVE